MAEHRLLRAADRLERQQCIPHMLAASVRVDFKECPLEQKSIVALPRVPAEDLAVVAIGAVDLGGGLHLPWHCGGTGPLPRQRPVGTRGILHLSSVPRAEQKQKSRRIQPGTGNGLHERYTIKRGNHDAA
ncbi:hypothetical protein [Tabrizicola sp. YIM 78059]|uniref:hypothetical protein n=1 Tax=Tabrizicola sp. YIM 78059 TaxID=2529861 RepID=UPI0010AB0CAA|nr:hypothetical protein [Tabrizicola sp. YIM 78059]